MNLSITPELQKLIQRKVDSGLYANASEVVRDALRRMDERPADPWAPLREFLAPRIEAAERAEERGELITIRSAEEFLALARGERP